MFPRIERTENDSLTIYVKEMKNLLRGRNNNCLFEWLGEEENTTLNETKSMAFQTLYATIDYQEMDVYIASAKRERDNVTTSESPFKIESRNLQYYCADIIEREPTTEELEEYEHIGVSSPTTVYEITIPNPIRLMEGCQEMSAGIQEKERRKYLGQTFQKKIEYAKWVDIKLSYRGNEDTLPVEWRKDGTKDGIRNRKMTLKETWREMFNLSYTEYFATRLKLTDNTEFKLEPTELVALEIVDEAENETYCQYCGKIDTIETFFTVQNKADTQKRMCESCIKRRKEIDESVLPKLKR